MGYNTEHLSTAALVVFELPLGAESGGGGAGHHDHVFVTGGLVQGVVLVSLHLKSLQFVLEKLQ